MFPGMGGVQVFSIDVANRPAIPGKGKRTLGFGKSNGLGVTTLKRRNIVADICHHLQS